MGYVASQFYLNEYLINRVDWQTFNIVTANATECLGLGHGTFGSSSSVSTEPTSVATASANLSVCRL